VILFDIGDDVSIDMEKIESVVLKRVGGKPTISCVMVSGSRHEVSEAKVKSFFSTLKMVERGDALSKQYVVV
jgi:hypothetical protein